MTHSTVKVVGENAVFTLQVSLSTDAGLIPVDADALPGAVITDSTGGVLATFAGPAAVNHVDTGEYNVVWAPTVPGELTITWSFLYGGNPYTDIETFLVFVVGTSGSGLPEGFPGYPSVIRVVHDHTGLGIENMTVQAYDADNAVLLESLQTDAVGEVTFVLDVDNHYSLRFYGDHLRASVESPQTIKVVVPPPVNEWQFTATTFLEPQATSPDRCRCWAFFTDPAGNPLRGHYIRLVPMQNPAVTHTVPHGYSQTPTHLTTDDQGYVQVDLIRGGAYTVTMSGYLDVVTDITVPAVASANLVDILFPTPASLTFTPAAPSTVAVGATGLFVPALVMADGSILSLLTDPPATDYVTFTSTNEAVMTVSTDAHDVVVTGVGAGTANLSATVRADVVMPRIPPAPFAVTPVVVTVP